MPATSISLKRLVTVGLLFLLLVFLSTSDARRLALYQAPPETNVIIEPTEPQPPWVTSDASLTKTDERPSTTNADNAPLHILLAGVDSGDTGYDYGRTDSIILVTLDPIGEKIKLTSFMRDLYVEIPGHGYSKLNAAHAWGGMQLLKDTLAANFGLTLDRHVVIDFSGFERAIDLLGGVEIEIKDYEVPYVNTSGSGVQLLSGSQALHYVRLRNVGNSDYERTERQRRVLAAMLKRARQIPVSDYIHLYREIEPYFRTNFSILETLRIGYITLMLKDAEVETLRIPVDGTYEATYRQEMAVLIPDLEANNSLLNDFLYPEVDREENPLTTYPIEPSR